MAGFSVAYCYNWNGKTKNKNMNRKSTIFFFINVQWHFHNFTFFRNENIRVNEFLTTEIRETSDKSCGNRKGEINLMLGTIRI